MLDKMKMPLHATLLAAGSVLLAGAVLTADGTRFSDFTPLSSSAGPTADESLPLTLGNPEFQQRSIADRATQLGANIPNSGDWDMNTVNETGPHKGRFLFTVFESHQSGVQRHDLLTGVTDTLWYSPAAEAYIRFDPSFWTPWGTLITGQEEWCTNATGCTTNIYGRLFELRNPIEAPPIFNPVTGTSNINADFVHRNVIPRTAHEGIQFDRSRNMYFIDELDGGNIYKFTSAASWGEVMAGRADYFDAGQTFVLRVGNGATPGATGAFTWVPFTNQTGAPLPGALTITDPNGITSVDARNSTHLPAFRGTGYNRPEDMQRQSLRDADYLYFTATGTHEVYRVDLENNVISLFAGRSTINLATGLPVGTAFSSPDNLAMDAEHNIYIVEDQAGGVNDDIWFARDLNGDGDLTDPGEGVGRWASNGTPGSEFTGLYFDPTNKRRAWVNIQHPDSGNDRTIEITIP